MRIELDIPAERIAFIAWCALSNPAATRVDRWLVGLRLKGKWDANRHDLQRGLMWFCNPIVWGDGFQAEAEIRPENENAAHERIMVWPADLYRSLVAMFEKHPLEMGDLLAEPIHGLFYRGLPTVFDALTDVGVETADCWLQELIFGRTRFNVWA